MLLAAGGAMLALNMFKKKQATSGPSTPGGTPAKKSAQPGQQYPFTPNTPARVDNKNQPWYNGATTAMQNSTVAQDITAAASGLNSLSSVWGSLSKTFGGGSDPSADLQNIDSLPPPTDVAVTAEADNSVGYSQDVMADPSNNSAYDTQMA